LRALLSVDLGYRTGLALFGDDGRLRWYRSHNLGNVRRLRRAVERVLADLDGLVWIVVEGDRRLAEIWRRAARRRGIEVHAVAPEEWRSRLFLDRQVRTATIAKRHAGMLARQVIEWSDAPRPTSLRSDAAEAILIGLWGVLELGWLTDLPAALRPA
jgi:hypothetical protein